MTSAFTRPPSAQAAVLAELRRRISEGELRPGARVVAETVAKQLGVSRVPVREALQTLAGEGQVAYEPHRGYFIAELDAGDLRELYRMREMLEEEAVRAAVARFGEADLERLDEAMAALEEANAAGDVAAHVLANRHFHFTIYEASGMPLLVRYVRMLWDASDAYRSLYYNRRANRDAVAADHAAIRAALADRDTEAAVELLAAHRRRALEALLPLLGEHGSSAT